MSEMKIGLLPFYLQLYDECCQSLRPHVQAFANTIGAEYEKRGVEVIESPLCRVTNEFAAAIKLFEEAGVDAVITLHLAYSPSLESAEALAATDLPLIVLDTTPDFEFGPEQHAEKIMYNHGIHGVQDMCNLLLRNNKHFFIEAGHWQGDVIDRTMKHITAARLANNLRNSRVGIIGTPFRGMGDFFVPFDILKTTIGIEVVESVPETILELMPEPDSLEVAELMAEDGKRFDTSGLATETHRRSAVAELTVRNWLEQQKLSAFTFNFLNIDKASGFPTVPFTAASKAMAEGIGYAGEGDVLTAALTGALAKEFEAVTFTEMFCPDWQSGRVFMSHMGEISLNTCDGKPILREKDFPYTDADNPAFIAGRLKPGNAVLVNLAPGPDNRYTLIVAPVEVCDSQGAKNMEGAISGWLKPELELADFLTEYSKCGGTHHSTLVYNCDITILESFARLMNWQPTRFIYNNLQLEQK
jgi:L-arabinose isomerase